MDNHSHQKKGKNRFIGLLPDFFNCRLHYMRWHTAPAVSRLKRRRRSLWRELLALQYVFTLPVKLSALLIDLWVNEQETSAQNQLFRFRWEFKFHLHNFLDTAH